MKSEVLSQQAFESIVEAAVQAPSADNDHPFSFEYTGDGIRVWASDALVHAPYHRRMLALISLGAVLENMTLRARSLAWETSARLFPFARDSRVLAKLEISGRSAEPDPLADAIEQRHTNRRPFFGGPPLTAAEQRIFETEAASTGATRLVWLDARAQRGPALRLIRQAEAERFRDQAMHRELFSSIRFDVGWERATDQGLAPGALEVERPLRGAFQALRHWPLMRTIATLGAHHLLALRAAALPCRLTPHLAAIATSPEATDEGAVSVGRALERVWLRSAAMGLAFQPLAASTLLALDGYAAVRPALRQRLVAGWERLVPGMRPLMLFRLGRAAPARIRSGRRPAGAYLHEPGA